MSKQADISLHQLTLSRNGFPGNVISLPDRLEQRPLPLPLNGQGARTSLLYVVEGICNLSAHGRRFQLVPGEYCLVRAGEPWSADPEQSVRTRVKILKGHFLESALTTFSGENWLAELPVVRLEGNGEVKALLQLSSAMNQSVDQLLEAVAHDSQAARIIIERVMGRSGEWRESVCRRLWSARDYLAREARTNPALDDIAQLCCFSKSHFLRQYRLAFGMTPGEYVVQRKLKLAQLLVTATNFSVTQIANLSGYDSSSAFCRSFKACYGQSPQQFGRLHAC